MGYKIKTLEKEELSDLHKKLRDNPEYKARFDSFTKQYRRKAEFFFRKETSAPLIKDQSQFLTEILLEAIHSLNPGAREEKPRPATIKNEIFIHIKNRMRSFLGDKYYYDLPKSKDDHRYRPLIYEHTNKDFNENEHDLVEIIDLVKSGDPTIDLEDNLDEPPKPVLPKKDEIKEKELAELGKKILRTALKYCRDKYWKGAPQGYKVAYMNYAQGIEEVAIAKIMGVTSDSIYQHLQKARKKLKECYNEMRGVQRKNLQLRLREFYESSDGERN